MIRPSLFSVIADVECDPDGSKEPVKYYVYTTTKARAEEIVEKLLFDEHPHDLCKKGRPHVGVDTVRRGRTTKRLVLVPDSIITSNLEVFGE